MPSNERRPKLLGIKTIRRTQKRRRRVTLRPTKKERREKTPCGEPSKRCELKS